MSNFLTILRTYYSSNYAGLPKACSQRIALTFINDISTGVCFFLSLYFIETLHYDTFASGIILSFYGLGTVLGGIVGGKLSDNISPRSVSIVSLFIKSLAFLSLIKFTNYNFLISIAFIIGFTTYAFTTSNNVSILKFCKDDNNDKLKALNILCMFSNAGIGVSVICISFLAKHGYQYIFFGCFILLFFAAIALTSLKSSPIYLTKNDRTKSDLTASTINHKQNTARLGLILAVVFFVSLVVVQTSSTYGLYIKEAFPKWGLEGVGIIFALNPLLIIFLQAPFVNFFNKKNKILMLGIGGFLVGFGMFLLTVSSNFLFAILACITYTLGEMLFIPMGQLLCYEQAGENKKGESLGLFKSCYATSAVLGPSLGGYIFNHFGGDVVWDLSVVIGVICFLLCVLFRNNSSQTLATKPIY